MTTPTNMNGPVPDTDLTDVTDVTGAEVPTYLDEDGNVTDEAVIDFTQQYCWYLAWVMHHVTGWPIVAVTDGSLDLDGGTEWNHVLVQHPSGHLVDVTGLSTADDIFEEWAVMLELDLPEGSEAVLQTIPAEDFRAWLDSDPDSVSAQMAAATRVLADALVQKVGTLEPVPA